MYSFRRPSLPLRRFSATHSTANYKMFSFGIAALLTNVPLEAILRFLEAKFIGNVIEIPIPIHPLLQLIRLCEYFLLNDTVYKQIFGVARGSPESPVLANPYMEYLESVLLSTLTVQPPLWLPYVSILVLNSGHLINQYKIL